MYHPAPIGRRPSLVLFSASRVFGVRCLCAKMPLVMVTIASSLPGPGLASENRFYSCMYISTNTDILEPSQSELILYIQEQGNVYLSLHAGCNKYCGVSYFIYC